MGAVTGPRRPPLRSGRALSGANLGDGPVIVLCLMMTRRGRLWVTENMAMRVLMTIAVTAAALFAAGCTANMGHPAVPPASQPPDQRNAPALLKIATAFNHEYDSSDYGPVYARWDARSEAIITRTDYIRQHKDCAGAPQAPSRTESAEPGPHGAWLVHYETGGQQLTDYWFYVHRRWVFDLVLSNPDAARLYRMSRSITSRLSAVHTDPSPAGRWLAARTPVGSTSPRSSMS